MGHRASILVPIVLAALATSACSADIGSDRCATGRDCDDGGGGPAVDGGRDGGVDGGVAMMMDAGIPAIDGGPPAVDAFVVSDTGPPPPSCAWVWLDRGGPAFQPTACRPGPGVVDGMLVDPMAFFADLVAGRDPDTWETVMNEIEGELWSCGVGQQRGSGGDVRGRLFLPTAACPDSSPPPGDMRAMLLGVRQEEACWTHPADVVECP